MHARAVSWWSLVAAAAVGLPVHHVAPSPASAGLLSIVVGGLSLRIVPLRAALVVAPVTAALVFLLLTLPLPPMLAAVFAALLAQVALAWIGREQIHDERSWSRRLLPVAGHLAVLAGDLILLVPGGADLTVGILAFVGGFSILVLHATWSRGLSDPAAEGWDVPILALLSTAALAATTAYVATTGLFEWLAPAWAPSLLVVEACAVLVLAALCAPPALAGRLRAGTRGAQRAFANGVAFLGVVNVLFVVFAIVAMWSARTIIVLLTAYLLVAVTMEYRAVRKARLARGLFTEASPIVPAEPLTVLIAARDEGDTLRESLEANLRLGEHVRFLLVCSASSTDDTTEVARAAEAAHPGRVRVVIGTGTTKAQDLNQAWPHLETELVLILDADETVGAAGIAWGLAALRADPRAAVVQGRKVSRAPAASRLARFIATERRHATGLDHLLHAQLGSTHFAGSAAILRRDVVAQAGGWTDRTLTEDIEFTLRLHLSSSWRILYEPRFLVREADPGSWSALIEQRTRWARGWAQCFVLYFGEVIAHRKRLGAARAFGLAWLLLMSVSAPVMALFPAFLLMRAVGIPSLLPLAVGATVAVFILPARLVGYAYSALYDPHIPSQRTPRRLAETIGFAYVWILLGWILGLHALLLEISKAPRVWYVTRKATDARAQASARGPAKRGVVG